MNRTLEICTDACAVRPVVGMRGDDRGYGRQRSRGDGCELERSAASGDERNRPQRRPRDDDPAATSTDGNVERSRGDGCESERSAASGDERNRPWRRPRDDFVGYMVHTFVENLSTSMCTFLFRICREPQKYVPYVLFALPPVVVARSTLRAITFVQNSAALRFTLTSIAPTHAAVASVGPLPTSPEGEESDVDDRDALPFRGGLGGAAIQPSLGLTSPVARTGCSARRPAR
jgi:hypothetical protein